MKLLADGIINCSTWTTQPGHVVNVTKGDIFPGIPAEDWGLPITKQFIVSQGPRPVALDGKRLTSSYNNDLRNIAGYVDLAASEVIGRRNCGTFARTTLPKKFGSSHDGKTSMNKKNYV